ncbi:hypothetical protein ABH999_005006 [Bradyrhizobium yuanmingense]
MSQTSIERLREYLAQLPPQSQALLMREFERALERGQDTAVATLVLEQLRKIVRKSEADEALPPRTDDLSRGSYSRCWNRSSSKRALLSGPARFAAPRCSRSGSGLAVTAHRTR